MILIKLGGSIITNKRKPLTPRRGIIGRLARSLRQINESLILVHGGGSYGHHWSVKYDMHTKPDRYDTKGVAVVKNSMVELNKIVLEVLLKNKINPYCFPPAGFMQGNKPTIKKIREIAEVADSNLVPVTFGDALWYGQGKTYILSGDKIMTHLAGILKPRLCIFALNEDGLYDDPKTKRLIREYDNQMPPMQENKMDVTGGMMRKLQEATQICKDETRVFFVNGTKPERIVDAIKNNKFDGTIFGGSLHD